MFLWLSRNLFLLPKYNKAAESVFLTKYCALRNVISFFIAKYNHDKFSSDISCQGIEEFEYLPSIRPKFKGKEEFEFEFPMAYIYNNRWQIRYEGLRKKGILKRNTLNTSLYKDPWWPKSLNIVNNPPSYLDLSIAPSRDDNG